MFLSYDLGNNYNGSNNQGFWLNPQEGKAKWSKACLIDVPLYL